MSPENANKKKQSGSNCCFAKNELSTFKELKELKSSVQLKPVQKIKLLHIFCQPKAATFKKTVSLFCRWLRCCRKVFSPVYSVTKLRGRYDVISDAGSVL